MKKMLIIPALLVMTLFFSLTDLEAGEKGVFDIEAKLNDTLIYFDPQNTRDVSGAAGFSKVKSLNSGVEMVMNIKFDDGNVYSSRFLIVVDYCSTAYPSLGNIATPGTADFTNLTYLDNYSSNNAGSSCKVGNYTGSLYKAVYAVTKGVADSEFSLRLWGGSTFDYVTWFKINGISIFDYTSELELSFQNIKNQQELENKLNNLNNTQQETNNKLNDLNNKHDQTNSKLDDLNSKLTDTTAPDTSGFGNVSGWLPDGPVDSILTLPVKVMNTISGVLAGTCNPVSLPLPFISSNLELPCGDSFYDNITGLNVFLNTLGFILGCYLLYSYLIYLYNWVDKKVSMVENDREKWGAV